MGELYHGKKFNANFEKSVKKCLASCDMCQVKFFSKNQVKQHKLYHMSQEFHNFWLTSYKNLPSYNAVDGLSLEFLGNDSKFWKYDKFKPTENNSVFKAKFHPKCYKNCKLIFYFSCFWADWEFLQVSFCISGFFFSNFHGLEKYKIVITVHWTCAL